MKKLVLACCLIAGSVFAADAAKPADAKPAEGAAPQWKPKAVAKKDTKGIEALYKQMDELAKKGDVEGLAALYDFPALMLTDNSAGVVMGAEWDKEKWVATMKPAFENMPKDMKHSVKTKPTFISESIAFVEESNTRSIGKAKPESWTSGSFVVLKDGKWMFKAGAEGGWGDMMPPPAEKKADAAPADSKAAPGQKTADNKAPAAQPAAQPAKK
jgi:hypothetical protein